MIAPKKVWDGRLSASVAPWAWVVFLTTWIGFCAVGISFLPPHLKLGAIAFVVLATVWPFVVSVVSERYFRLRATIERHEGTATLRVWNERNGRALFTMPIRGNTPVIVKCGGKIVAVGDVDPFVYCAYAVRPVMALRCFDSAVVLRGLERPLEFADCLQAVKLENTH